MNQVAFLLNPVQIPKNLLTKALKWAQEHRSAFKVIVITDEEFSVEHIAGVQNVSDDDALHPIQIEGHKINVIIRQVKYIRQHVTECSLLFSSRILVKPRLLDVIEEIKLANMIFFEFPRDWENSSFDWLELVQHIPMHKRVISNKVHG